MKFLIAALLCATMLFGEGLKSKFEEQGYLVIENFWSQEECNSACSRAKDLLNECTIDSAPTIFHAGSNKQEANQYFLDSVDKVHYFFEPKAFDSRGELTVPTHLAINKIGHGLAECDPQFNTLTFSPKFKSLLSDLGYEDPACVQSMLIFKQPHIGGAVPLHQDSTFLLTTPNTLIGFWIALEDVTLENGCLWVLPGGHTMPLWDKFGRDDEGKFRYLFRKDPNIDQSKFIPLEIKKGSLIVIHGMVPHLSLANESSKSRWAYTFHCMECSSSFDQANWIRRKENNPFHSFH